MFHKQYGYDIYIYMYHKLWETGVYTTNKHVTHLCCFLTLEIGSYLFSNLGRQQIWDGPIASPMFVQTWCTYGILGGTVSLKGMCTLHRYDITFTGVSLFGKVPWLTSCLYNFWKPMSVPYMYPARATCSHCSGGVPASWELMGQHYEPEKLDGEYMFIPQHYQLLLPKSWRMPMWFGYDQNSFLDYGPIKSNGFWSIGIFPMEMAIP